ncbi:heterokaryon incompatibility protein-domain-containing protein, partial [Fusarium oxysporum]
MAGFLPSPTEDECQRCAELGIRNVLGEELLNESSNLIAQRVFFDSQNSIDPSSCPSCWASCRLHRSIQPARIFNEDPAWADPNSLLRNSHWTCMLSSQEVGRLDCKPGSRPMLQDTFGKGLAEDASGTVRIVQKIPNYAVVLAWLENCHKEHLSCQRKYSPCLKNIFLIDVEEEALVCYPSDAGKLIHYLALSYVWGSFEANYQVTGPGPIAIERLPQTVQDSIIVTKDLRQRYLWVDQVCINQDKKIKKNEQLGYMASIYGGAWATIVAADSNDSNSGLSRVRPESQRSHQLRIEFGNGNIMLQKLPSFEQQMAVSPWIQRGWTYQEALLSQRLVLFTKHQVYYSCNSMLCCEALDDEKTFGGSTKPLSYDMNDEVKNPPKIDLHFPTKKELRNNKLFEYERLVNLYCKRQLTHSQDILVAFSAL